MSSIVNPRGPLPPNVYHVRRLIVLAVLLGRIRGTTNADPDPVNGSLTEREAEILSLMREGLTNKQIANRLHISVHTVKNHVQKILRKLGANNRAQAVGKADSLGLFAIGARARSGDSPSGA